MKKAKKPSSARHSASTSGSQKTVQSAKPARAAHIHAISRQVWLLYLNSAQIRFYMAYLVLSKKYPKKNICGRYCKTYASRKRCQHIASSPWTHFSVSAAAVLCLLVALQLAYPSDRTLPLARLQGHGFVGFKTQGAIAGKIDALDQQSVAVRSGSSAVISSYDKMGLEVDVDTTFDELRRYTVAQRLIPFSILLAGNKTADINRHVDDARLDEFTEKIGASISRQPRDAAIIKQGTKLVVIPAEDGYESSPQIFKQQILQTTLQNEAIILSPRIIPPRISSQAASEKARQMQSRIDNPLVIRAAEASLTADPEMLASWVDIIPNPKEGNFDLSFNKIRVENFLKPLPGLVDQPSKPEVVTLLNGLVAGTSQGSAGRSLNFGDLAEEVSATLNPGTTTVWAKVNSILPEQLYDRRYSRDSLGIQSLIDYWVQVHGGQPGIDFRTINGQIAASAGPYKKFSAAGSNKLFIAHLIAGRLDAGSVQPASATSAGTNVAGCMDKMLRFSDTACTLALGNIVGWGTSDFLLRSQGFMDTELVYNGGNTSASDTSAWFTQLLGGSLTSAEQKNFIIDKLARQTIRTGIPAGSAGILVANKAGYSGGSLYDAGVVYHPRGAYVLSVFSDGGSFAAIAELASQINRVLSE